MLVLTREIGETFNIGNDITVKVLGISGNQVRLGIDAPQSVRIHRAEVLRRIASRLQNLANRFPGR
ncbi:carbon storage regulator CsrA [Pseudomonas petrae]|uniref:Translational regulator CsrA n=1 Tax=Pseudomonas petrae TaxID=2912190 RepID=A0ABS9I056_9PSED|nr:carbon storage regulator CsrA [Pseudomonas petrae]MCF7530880.1 carbon storage regulator CsrA [Pseudomonas petrae]MCF7536554.1 carbon storage regulator CsrA [Pseudomonas petrae]MCF7541197.1 carbon storage regulator CsrA [Pseudomonas petrae]MCF7554233.1 carbon storage regulator CsrA [Pseudomonas petrae]